VGPKEEKGARAFIRRRKASARREFLSKANSERDAKTKEEEKMDLDEAQYSAGGEHSKGRGLSEEGHRDPEKKGSQRQRTT